MSDTTTRSAHSHAPTSAPTTAPAAASPALVLELARYTTRPEHEAEFRASHAAAIGAMRAAFPSLGDVTVVKLATTSDAITWVDVALWTSEDEAHRAAAECMSVPEFAACARFMGEVLGVEHGAVVARL